MAECGIFSSEIPQGCKGERTFMNTHKKTTRRNFLRRGRNLACAALAAPWVIPASVLGGERAVPPSDRIVMGFIGAGTMGSGHMFGEAWTYLPGGYLARNEVQIAAICDVWKDRREKARDRVDLFYTRKFGKEVYPSPDLYTDFRNILDRKDIDAVLIATPIHWHATMTVLAAQAGKDIYCEKPTAVSIQESQVMVKAVLDNKRVFQAGTQQRSEYEGKFRHACELVRNGRIGQLKEIYACREGGGATWKKENVPDVPVPEGLDWDLFLGPAPKLPYPGFTDPHWFGYGGINWGQHHYDIVQWSLDADRTGPIELYVDNGAAAYRYANGVVVYGRPYPGQTIGDTGGAWFVGTEGKIGVDREHLVAEPAEILDKPIGENDVHLYKSDSHSLNFLECIRTRKPTICDIETAHRAASVLLLGGIVQTLNRRLVWDPVKERFANDDEANALLSLPKREPWVI